MLNKVIKLMFPILLLAGCSEVAPPRLTNLDSTVKKLSLFQIASQTGQVNICSLIDKEWDKVWIIPPYTPRYILSQISATGIASIRGELAKSEFDESIIQLVFQKGDNIVAYGSLKRHPVDFAELSKQSNKLQFIEYRNCGSLTGRQNKYSKKRFDVTRIN